MLHELFERNRLLAILHDELAGTVGPRHPVLRELMDYIEVYARANRIGAATAEAAYLRFIGDYRKDVLRFLRTGRYPGEPRDYPRLEYDLALLLSTVLTGPRFRIMQLLVERTVPTESALVVGVGSGLELHLLRNRVNRTVAYDLCLNPAIKKLQPAVIFHEEEFRSTLEKYDQIFLIELLEHLEAPLDLVARCAAALDPGGRIHLTTATNIPQFDHRTNFPADHREFEAGLRQCGLEVLFREDIPHPPAPKDVGARNAFYTVARLPPPGSG